VSGQEDDGGRRDARTDDAAGAQPRDGLLADVLLRDASLECEQFHAVMPQGAQPRDVPFPDASLRDVSPLAVHLRDAPLLVVRPHDARSRVVPPRDAHRQVVQRRLF
jgi:hypothetical protein